MAITIPAKLGTTLNWLYLICVISFAVAIAHHHVKFISHELPLDYNETGMLVITSTIANGENPFSFESQPSRISLYPIFYNIVVAPLSHVFGNTLQLHRVVSGLFIVACSVLCFFLCRRDSGKVTESFIAALLVYAGLLFYSTPIASPNSLGLFLFLSAIAIPWVNRFSTRSLGIAIVLGILAFYTKQYFVACLGYVALYLFLAVSKKRAILFGLAALFVFIAVLMMVCYTSPYYLENTVFAIGSSANLVSSNEIVIRQLKEYSMIYLPVLIILTVAITQRLMSNKSVALARSDVDKKPALVNLADWDQPFLGRSPSYIWLCCACSLLIIVLVLGKNPGNHLTYLFQLISPFLLVGVFSLNLDAPKWRWFFRVLIVFAMHNSYFMLSRDFSVNDESWNRVREEISSADDIYASTLVINEILKKGGPVYSNGHTRYFPFGSNKPTFFIKTEPGHTVPEIWERHVDFIQSKIENKEFDLLLIDYWMHLPKSAQESAIDTKVLLKRYYRRVDTISLPLMDRLGGGEFSVQIWKPKLDATEAE